MGDIVLSAGVRQNLLALQNTARLMSTTQNRLATGKKVNTALDNPFNFFTSQSLNNRARDLNALLDSIGQAQQTIAAADHGITAITKLVESAKSVAKQAQQVSRPSATYNLAITGITAIAADTAATLTGTVTGIAGANTLDDFDGGGTGLTTGQTITVSDGTNTETFTVGADPTTEDIDDILTALNGGSATWTVAVNGGAFEIVSDNATDTITVSGSAAAALGFGVGNTSSGPENATIGGLSGTVTVQVGATAAQTIAFGAGNVTNRAELSAALTALTGVTATINGANQISITSSTDDAVTLGGTDAAAFFAAANIGANVPTATVTTPSSTRANLQSQYNDLLTQIDGLARDASNNGTNLLFGDDLTVTFNEDGSSFLALQGVTFNALGLNLTNLAGNEFQTDVSIDAVLAAVDSALNRLRTQASDFGSKLGTVQTRQDFTKSLIQTLETGADNLVLADANEESANMLALQTRQSLSTTALSLSAQADQAVLRLFG